MTPSTPVPSPPNGTYLRPSPLQVATCWVHGLLPEQPLPRTGRTPREALEDAIRPALLDGPCNVTFSGGRDSSAVLAVATDLARREGHPDPLPVTRVYPALDEADESQWQELVVRHLGLRDWCRLELDQEHDLLGTAARTSLRRRGLVWPPALQVQDHLLRSLDGGWVLTGEGGDQSLGGRRVTPLTALRASRRRPSRALARASAEALVPRAAQGWLARRAFDRTSNQEWLRPDVRARHHRLAAADAATEPLSHRAGTWWIARSQAWATMVHNHAIVVAEHDLQAGHPLLDQGFLAALARAGGTWGWPSRTATMIALFDDLLPRSLLTRSSKASFNRAYRGRGTRAFARSWDGSGVDTRMVDPVALRRQWLSDRPTATSALLLHTAWLASPGTMAPP